MVTYITSDLYFLHQAMAREGPRIIQMAELVTEVKVVGLGKWLTN